MQKYQQYFQMMIEENKDLFDNFTLIHDSFVLAPDINQAKFNAIGSEILDVVRDYERRLCGKSESGKFGKFSSKLAEKFWDEIRKVYSKIDRIGIT